MLGSTAYPQTYIEVYPFEGGRYAIQGGTTGLLTCIVEKKIKDGSGTFELHLAPGGPFGPNGGLTWSDIITPLSFVLIGMVRKNYRQIVMIGIVTTISEGQEWTSGSPVRRSITISGMDFGYFFSMFSWNALTFLGAAGTAVGQAIGNDAAGIPAILGASLLGGQPDQAGKEWFTTIMDGDKGILSKTYFNYRGSQVTFQQAVGYWFEEYPGFKIPYGINYLTSEGSWLEKFHRIFQFPWYEFFIITAPTGFYPKATGGFAFSMQMLGQQYTANPVVVARINVLPYRKVGTDGGTFESMDMTRWNALQKYTIVLGDDGLLSSNTALSEAEVKNFYMLNSIWAKALLGITNNDVNPFIFNFAGFVDPASIHRYGFRPAIVETEYFVDQNGLVAQGNAGNTSGTSPASGSSGSSTNIVALAGDLLARVFSYYEPTPFMMRANLDLLLRPDIMPGCKFEYQPFKSEPLWTFFIESVKHRFDFGGNSKTTLSLSRGLPSTVYGDSGDSGVLPALHIGNAQRVNGTYQVGLPQGPNPDTALESIPIASAGLKKVLADIGKVYVTPQQK